ncbi:MAG: hypothetical protein IJY50_10015 [Clostridia bacterium]|nr:hypothetical protein [Clostridia bacterium]
MLQAGFARLDITPPLGSSLAGYFVERKADGILDPIELNAVAIRCGEQTVVLIAADIISMDGDQSLCARQMIAEECGVATDHIAINCLHQHTTVRIGRGAFGITSGYYLELFRRKLVDVTKLALEDLKPATLGIAQQETAEPISFIRRLLMKDGTTRTNPRRQDPNIDHPIGTADNTVRLLRFFREGAADIALVNFATHPDVIGGTKFSADWPGFARRFVEKDLENVRCALFNGTQGDTNHIDFSKPAIEDRYGYSAHMGRVIADTVLAIWGQTSPHTVDRLYGKVETIYNKTRTDGEERYEDRKAFFAAYEAGTLDYKPGITELGEARRIINIRTDPIYRPVNVTVIGIGGVAFVGFGGEPFTEYAHEIRRCFPDMLVLTGCNTNGSVGYLPTKAAFEEGGYEGRGTPLSPNLQEQLVGAALHMLNEM